MLQLSCLSISARLASSQPAAPIIRVIEIIDDELLEDLAIAGHVGGRQPAAHVCASVGEVQQPTAMALSFFSAYLHVC
jgi:hypothetical protein